MHLFDLAAADIAAWRSRLIGAYGDPLPVRRRSPLGQLLKSILSSRTRDAISTAAYDALVKRFPVAGTIARAAPGEVEQVIHEVTYAADKAVYLVNAAAEIGRRRPDFDLEFLALPPLDEALDWLERPPGVGRKVSASTLNASNLNRPVFIVDTHVLRVLQRLRFVGETADYRLASETVTAAMPRWSGDDFLGLHILMKRLGQSVCRWDAPDCAVCPLAEDCPVAARTGRS